MSEQVCVVEWFRPSIQGVDGEDFIGIRRLYDQFVIDRTAPDITPRQVMQTAAHEHLAVARRGPVRGKWRPIVGMGTLYVLHALGGNVGRIGEFVVDEKERRTGIGAALVEFMVSEARKMGCLQLRLTSDGRRLDAHRFWERQGFSFKDSKVMRMQL